MEQQNLAQLALDAVCRAKRSADCSYFIFFEKSGTLYIPAEDFPACQNAGAAGAPNENFCGRLDPSRLGELQAELLQKFLAAEPFKSSWKFECASNPGSFVFIELQWDQSANGPAGEREWVGLAKDVTAAKAAGERNRIHEALFRCSAQAMIITDENNRIVDANPAFSKITGFPKSAVMGRDPKIFASGLMEPSFYQNLWKCLRETGQWDGLIVNRKHDGSLIHCLTTILAVKDPQGRVLHYVAAFNEENPAAAEPGAGFCPVTGLPGRTALNALLEQKSALAGAHKPFAILFIDLDGFKNLNDKLGHEAGDAALRAFSDKLRALARKDDFLCRLGGDEFAMIVDNAAGYSDAERITTKVLEAARMQWPAPEGATVRLSASVGISHSDMAKDQNFDEVLRQADHCMYLAKTGGKNRSCKFTEQNAGNAGKDDELIAQALDMREFVLHFQPKTHIATGELVGMEALCRWHKDGKILTPDKFLPIIYGSRHEIAFTEYILRRALEAVCQLKAVGKSAPVSVNVTNKFLHQDNFISKITDIFSEYPQAQYEDIEFEILEIEALENLANISGIIEQLRAIGISFSLDDFGTGYSSLHYLRKLNPSVLKIDRSFIAESFNSPEDLTMLNAIIGLGRSFNKKIIAEGVETLEQAKLLLRFGCSYAQGYYFSKPKQLDDLIAWIDSFSNHPELAFVKPVNEQKLPLMHLQLLFRQRIEALLRCCSEPESIVPELAGQFERQSLWAWFDRHPDAAYDELRSLHLAMEGQALAALRKIRDERLAPADAKAAIADSFEAFSEALGEMLET